MSNRVQQNSLKYSDKVGYNQNHKKGYPKISLSDPTCKNAHKHEKAKAGKPFKLFDEKGLYLLLTPKANGWSKGWRLKYRFNGKEKLLSIGVYPSISLMQARSKRDECIEKLAKGIDPSESRKAEKIAKFNDFERITRDWLASTAHTIREILPCTIKLNDLSVMCFLLLAIWLLVR